MSRKRESPKPDRRAAAPRPRAEKFEQAFEKIYRIVLKIPRGRVMTYGQIARLMDDRYSPRLVGWAMHATPRDGRDIPWHRVINSKGGISTGRVIIAEPQLQRYLLEAEGVVFDARGHCDLSAYQWSPPKRKAKGEAPGGQKGKTAKPTKTPAKARARR
ncbi:MAG TPA: MGMT family protein [Blastocatellia bacterium]|nr:MGMT family protein [Blastocatellia bacterium]